MDLKIQTTLDSFNEESGEQTPTRSTRSTIGAQLTFSRIAKLKWSVEEDSDDGATNNAGCNEVIQEDPIDSSETEDERDNFETGTLSQTFQFCSS